MTFNENLLLKQGLEYSVILPCGHTVKYLSKCTASVYESQRGAKVIPPIQGPEIPECFKDSL